MDNMRGFGTGKGIFKKAIRQEKFGSMGKLKSLDNIVQETKAACDFRYILEDFFCKLAIFAEEMEEKRVL